MAYVRQRGNQVLIVHGERDPETKNVEQRILFTLYSKAEAHAVLGRGDDPATSDTFRRLLEKEHPDLRFDWKAIHRGITELIEVLPDAQDYRRVRLQTQFRSALRGFARQLMLADPQDLVPAGELIRDHQHELAYLSELIAWRLKLCGEREANQWNSDNAFFWRFALQGRNVPCDTEEHAAGLYERGELDRAEAVFRLLVETFDDYAEGYNYLGLIALSRRDLDAAAASFEKTMEIGRKHFPKKIARSRYWRDLSTRPYMRGLRNLTLVHVRAERYDEAAELCDRLASECGDTDTASWHRAEIALNTGKWRAAADLSDSLRGLWPTEGFVTAFAYHELGEHEEAMSVFLHATLNAPCAARVLLGVKSSPATYFATSDHNSGVALHYGLAGYLRRRGARALTHFRSVFRDPRVVALVKRVEDLRATWNTTRTTDRSAFDEIKAMETTRFAREKAAELRAGRLARGKHRERNRTTDVVH